MKGLWHMDIEIWMGECFQGEGAFFENYSYLWSSLSPYPFFSKLLAPPPPRFSMKKNPENTLSSPPTIDLLGPVVSTLVLYQKVTIRCETIQKNINYRT